MAGPRLNSLMTTTQLSSILLAAYGIGVLMLLRAVWQTVRLLQHQAHVAGGDAAQSTWPTVDIVVPVKDEEAHIRTCLESILAQDYPAKRIIVVNDRSTDNTAGVVASLQQTHPEIRLVNITDLPDGCYGKPHALSVASRELSGEVLAFVDSDFELAPNCLRTLVGHLRTSRLDWLAVMGAPELSYFWERLLVPLLGAVTYAWYDPRRIADPEWDNAIGSGFLVVRREAYDTVGGHAAVIRAYDEDSEIMRIAKRAGHKVSYVLTPELFTLRMYGTLQRTIRGITRTFIGGLKTLPRCLITINGLNFVSLLPIGVVAGIGAASLAGLRIPYASAWLGVGAFHLLLSMILAVLIYSRAGHSRFALLHPLGAAMLIAICVRAAGMLKTGKPITWRGTSY